MRRLVLIGMMLGCGGEKKQEQVKEAAHDTVLPVAHDTILPRFTPPKSKRRFTATLVASTDSILLQDNFESGYAYGWTGQVGTWTVTTDSGNYVYKNTNPSGDNWAINGQTTWKDYAVEARVKPLSFPNTSGGIVRIFSRWQDASNWYYMNLTKDGHVQLRRYTTGGVIKDLVPQKVYPVVLGTWYTMRLEASGTSLRAYINGVLQLSATDTLFKSGPMAVGGWNDLAEFDNIRVIQLGIQQPPPPPPPPPVTTLRISVNPSSATITLGQDIRFNASVYDSLGNPTTQKVTWKPLDTTVATVDTSGRAFPKKVGSTLITANIGSVVAGGTLVIGPARFDKIYAKVVLAAGRLTISRVDSGVWVEADSVVGARLAAGYLVRFSTANTYSSGMRRLADDVAAGYLADSGRSFGVQSNITVKCQVICQLTIGNWNSSPVNVSVIRNLANALDAAARGDSVFAAADSLPYLRKLP